MKAELRSYCQSTPRAASRLVALLVSGLLLHGCAQLQQHDQTSPEIAATEAHPPAAGSTPTAREAPPPVIASTTPEDAPPPLPSSSEPEAPEPPPDLWQSLREGLAIPAVENRQVTRDRQWWIRHRGALDRLLTHGSEVLPYLWQQTRQRGLPAELALLPAVESGFRPYAYSREGAAGLWQIMPATGKYLGLRQDWWYDARRDLIASTDAALNYLEQLNREFNGNWLHALAAYNAGAGTVRVAIRKNRRRGKPTDFWHLDLPGETDRYVPRLLALAELVRDPGKHGVTLPAADDKFGFTIADAGSQIDLGVAARLAGVDLAELLAMNGGFNRGATPPEGPHRLLLPLAAEDRFNTALAALPDAERLRWTRHKIKSGETLSHIARRHGISVKAIKQANGLKSSRIRAGKNLVIPLSATDSVALASRTSRSKRSKVHYRVRKGDSLYRIARKYKVKISSLRRWNALNSKYLQPGQTLTVYIDPTKQTL